ncbi:MAG: AMP-binding protein, partial [Bacteroidota bacterium]
MDSPKRLFDFPYYQLRNFPLDVMVTSRQDGHWKSYSTSSFIEWMNLASAGLIELGIRPGDRVALITDGNRSEWNILDHAILQIGAIDVPVYPTMTEQDYEYIFNHAGVRMCFVSNQDLWHKVNHVLPSTPDLRDVFTFELVAGARHWTELIERGRSGNPKEVK